MKLQSKSKLHHSLVTSWSTGGRLLSLLQKSRQVSTLLQEYLLRLKATMTTITSPLLRLMTRQAARRHSKVSTKEAGSVVPAFCRQEGASGRGKSSAGHTAQKAAKKSMASAFAEILGHPGPANRQTEAPILRVSSQTAAVILNTSSAIAHLGENNALQQSVLHRKALTWACREASRW